MTEKTKEKRLGIMSKPGWNFPKWICGLSFDHICFRKESSARGIFRYHERVFCYWNIYRRRETQHRRRFYYRGRFIFLKIQLILRSLDIADSKFYHFLSLTFLPLQRSSNLNLPVLLILHLIIIQNIPTSASCLVYWPMIQVMFSASPA